MRLGKWSLRARIVLTTLVLVSAGLIFAEVATYQFLGSFLRDRVDQQLERAAIPLAATLGKAERPSSLVRLGKPSLLPVPVGTYAAVVNAEGKVKRQKFFPVDSKAFSAPDLPPDLPGSSSSGSGRDRVSFTISDARGKTEYRVLAQALPKVGTFVIAIPLGDVRATKRRLLLIELAVAGLVIVSITGAGFWLIGRELRPLERMGETASAIAAGDLTRRVQPDEPNTEVGKLGAALNSMLAQIERSFQERVESEQRLRRFLADVSHELRTPVTSIRGYAELFRRGAAERPDDLAKVMRRIEQEGERMGVLIDELLLLARLDQGLPLERETVDLARLVADSVEAARAIDPKRKTDLKIEDETVMVSGADVRLRQVIDNLLANVRLHTPPKTAIYVRVSSENRLAVIEVADEGPGIAPEEAARIFERFYRTERSRSGGSVGIGLGLAISKSIVEAHGGSLTYSAPLDGGSVFRVELPLERDDRA
jgi:two-component system OmpR family sensor kinase